jgi:uncharacterized protein HemY
VRAVACSADGGVILSAGDDATCRIWDLSRPAKYRIFGPRLEAAYQSLRADGRDPAALMTLGEWYAFRARWDWAADLLERAEAGGVEVSPLLLAQCYMKIGREDKACLRLGRALELKVAPEAYLRGLLKSASRPGR